MKALITILSFTLILPSIFLMAVEAASQPDFARLPCGELFPETLLESLVPQKGSKDVGAALRGEAWPQERVDQLYSCLSVDTLPDGFHDGAVIFPIDGGHGKFLAVLEKMGIELKQHDLEAFAQALWKGKNFDTNPTSTTAPEPMLRNRVLGRLLFPAKVYFGISIMDVRKDSIIIDYAYSDDFSQYYIPGVDEIATRKGLLIRDEIREIRPGLFLGRAYLDGVFGLNFVLSKHQ